MRNILFQGASNFGLQLTDDRVSSFSTYYKILEEKNKVMNLTAISGESEVAALHFLDSLALISFAKFKEKTMIDIGSGAGFPGVPIKIVEPTLKLTLLDAQQKRVHFLEELCSALQLSDVTCVHARAEEAALQKQYRDSFDYAVSRAVARLNVLAELCLPFVRPGGAFIAMKSIDSEEEVREAESAFRTLGAGLEAISDYEIPGTDVRHRVVIVRKAAPTPDEYPRRYAKIEKKPL